jgi:hypothetical protein
MILSTTYPPPVDLGPGSNNIPRGTPCRTEKTWTWMVFLTESTNDLGLNALSWILLLQMMMIYLAYVQELTSFPSGVFDVGYVNDLKYLRKISNSLLVGP